ncbi:uncharacterized protein LOC131954287 [Physella acuta]|uniref:uncharacterized protein LOC131954287 n=1 Tax=Physella acuta TaxID=109671 RepID=UPI0027DE2D1F|nr:uncharacterized protein LOC131954287 [Physella acuta]
MEAPNKLSITLALIGKTGNGKSSTANSILGRDAFKENRGTFFATPCFSIRGNLEIKVVDSPGFMDPDEENEILNVETQIPGIMSVCPEGIHALLLVLKYGNRFTTEDIETVVKIKQIFGVNIIKDHGIIIFTHGENFDMESEGCDESDDTINDFGTWCNQQTGPIQDLFKECGNRVVLFYNSHSKLYADKKEIAVEQLLNIAAELGKKGAYTNDKFKQCALERERLISEHKLPELKIEFQRKIDSLTQEICKYMESNKMTEKDVIELTEFGKQLLDEMDNISQDENLQIKVKSIQYKIEEIDWRKPIKEQLKPIIEMLQKLKNPAISVPVASSITSGVLLAVGVVFTIASGGLGSTIGAIALRVGGVSICLGVCKMVGNLLNKFKNK